MNKIKNATAYTQAIKTPGLIAEKLEIGVMSVNTGAVDSFALDAASTDNLDTAELGVVKLVPDAANRELSGIAAPDNGAYARKTLINHSAETLILKVEDASSTEGNQFLGETDYFLQAGRGVDVLYDVAAAGWRILANNDLSLT